MSGKEVLLEYLRRKADELRRELEIIEEIIRILDTINVEEELSEPHVIRDRSGVRITIPRPLEPGSVEAEYLFERLNEVLGENYEVQKDRNNKIRAIKIHIPVDDKLIREIKSIIKIVTESIIEKKPSV